GGVSEGVLVVKSDGFQKNLFRLRKFSLSDQQGTEICEGEGPLGPELDSASKGFFSFIVSAHRDQRITALELCFRKVRDRSYSFLIKLDRRRVLVIFMGILSLLNQFERLRRRRRFFLFVLCKGQRKEHKD